MSSAVEKNGIADDVVVTMDRGREATDRAWVSGHVEVELTGPDGTVKYREEGHNLVTDYGDDMLSTRSYDNAIEVITGMKLGTGATAASKAGAGGTLVTYEPASQEALDATPTEATKGAGLGWRITHICTWIAGDVTEVALAEVVLTNETPLTDVTSALGDVIARFVFGATIDKQAGDQLVVTWHLDFLGA